MQTAAAILVELAHPLEIVDLDIPPLQPGQVLVEIAYSGVCHTQLGEVRGVRGPDPFLPHCLGHEASGHVRDVGPGVTRVRTGQAVILSWIKGPGVNVPGTVYGWQGKKVNAGGVTTFSKFTVASENRLTPIADQFPLRAAALLGCPVPAGIGAVWNTAGAGSGKSVAVFGVGGVGCCAVWGAYFKGCHPIVAVDVNPWKLALARQFGATHTVETAIDSDVVSQVHQKVGGQLDFVIEASGRPSAMLQALHAVRPQGGIAVIVGNARHGEMLEIDPRWLNSGKQLRGTWGGDNLPERDFPHYQRLVEAGWLKLDPLLGKSYALADVNRALEELEQGTVARPILDMKA